MPSALRWLIEPGRLPVALLTVHASADALRGAAFSLLAPGGPRAGSAALDLLGGVAGLLAAFVAWWALAHGDGAWWRTRRIAGTALGIMIAADLLAVVRATSGALAGAGGGTAAVAFGVTLVALVAGLQWWLARWWWREVGRAAR